VFCCLVKDGDVLKKTKYIKTDILIIGGGTAGCMAAVFARQKVPSLDVVILEKAHIKRSGCLAKGVNAVNAFLGEDAPEDYLAYVQQDNFGVVRSDLVLSIGERLNRMTRLVEEMGVPMPKTDKGEYVKRSKRSVIMDGESIKPILAEQVTACGAKVYNRTPVYRLLKNGKGRVVGAAGFNLRTLEPVVVQAKAVIVCTGGASGIYHASNVGLERTKTWYCPYNAGSGLAMGIRAGAEMTSFEMRFVALRTKDIVAPTGTIVLGHDVRQCNSKGEALFQDREIELGRKLTTSERLFYTVREQKQGKGACFIDISRLNSTEYDQLISAYLNMSPSFVLELLEQKNKEQPAIEICGSEPYINGGHGMAGFWIDERRRTTLAGLYAVGDTAGGAPKKYLSGCFAEAEIAIDDILSEWDRLRDTAVCEDTFAAAADPLFAPLKQKCGNLFHEVEDRLHKIMEEHAGGSTQNYETDQDHLMLASDCLEGLAKKAQNMTAADGHELMRVHDTIDRVLLARVLVAHLAMRRETRWPCYQTRLDYPQRDDKAFRVFINSRLDNERIKMFARALKYPYAIVA